MKDASRYLSRVLSTCQGDDLIDRSLREGRSLNDMRRFNHMQNIDDLGCIPTGGIDCIMNKQ